jgi:hypothetical protein
MNVYCSKCNLGDAKGTCCMLCKQPFMFRCAYCGTYLTAAGQCMCITQCKKCSATHSRRKACNFFTAPSSGTTSGEGWHGSLSLSLGYPSVPKALSAPPLQYASFSWLLPRTQPIARCGSNFRYHKNGGKGALKYDPVGCSKIYDEASCTRLRELRGWGQLSFQFQLAIVPGCTDFSHKLMVVPSIGCPGLLCSRDIVGRLLWASQAGTRATVLFVHESEVDVYVGKVGDVLSDFGVGLVAWRSSIPVLGFGISRLAAQQCRVLFPDSGFEVILCDVNVVASSSVPAPKRQRTLPKSSSAIEQGYASDDDDMRRWKDKATFVYKGAGSGTGVPTVCWSEKTRTIEKTKAARGSQARPTEQVVVVADDELLYDPCFVTSSEDADLSAALEFELSMVSPKTSKSLKRKTPAPIDKLDLTASAPLTNAYTKLRDAYLQSLRHEDAIVIEYMDGGTSNVLVGDLAATIAKRHGLNALVIRSLIVEKILLTYKRKCIFVEDSPISELPGLPLDSHPQFQNYDREPSPIQSMDAYQSGALWNLFSGDPVGQVVNLQGIVYRIVEMLATTLPTSYNPEGKLYGLRPHLRGG